MYFLSLGVKGGGGGGGGLGNPKVSAIKVTSCHDFIIYFLDCCIPDKSVHRRW